MERTATQWDIRPGMDAYGADGNKVGKIVEVARDHIVVEKGLLFHTDFYVPASAVAKLDDDKVYLNVTKDEAVASGWDVAPDMAAGAPYDASGTGAYAAERDEIGESAAMGTTGYMGESPTSPGLAGDLSDGNLAMGNGSA